MNRNASLNDLLKVTQPGLVEPCFLESLVQSPRALNSITEEDRIPGEVSLVKISHPTRLLAKARAESDSGGDQEFSCLLSTAELETNKQAKEDDPSSTGTQLASNSSQTALT